MDSSDRGLDIVPNDTGRKTGSKESLRLVQFLVPKSVVDFINVVKPERMSINDFAQSILRQFLVQTYDKAKEAAAAKQVVPPEVSSPIEVPAQDDNQNIVK
jgi:hypothetical protein